MGPLLGDRLVGLFQEVSVQKVGGVMFVDIVADKLGGHRAGSFIFRGMYIYNDEFAS